MGSNRPWVADSSVSLQTESYFNIRTYAVFYFYLLFHVNKMYLIPLLPRLCISRETVHYNHQASFCVPNITVQHLFSTLPSGMWGFLKVGVVDSKLHQAKSWALWHIYISAVSFPMTDQLKCRTEHLAGVNSPFVIMKNASTTMTSAKQVLFSILDS